MLDVSIERESVHVPICLHPERKQMCEAQSHEQRSFKDEEISVESSMNLEQQESRGQGAHATEACKHDVV